MNKSTTQTANNIKFLGPAYLYNMLQDFRHLLIFDFREDFEQTHIRDAFHVYPGLNRDQILEVIDLAERKANEKEQKYKTIQRVRRYFFINNNKLEQNDEGVQFVMKCLKERESKQDKYYSLNQTFDSFTKNYFYMMLDSEKLKQSSEIGKVEFDKTLLYPYAKFPSEIIPGKLYLGNVYSSNSERQLNDVGIRCLIDFIDYNQQQKVASFKNSHQNYLHLPINNDIQVVIDFDFICKQIDEMLTKGKVLLYCKDGETISPAFAIAFLMYKAKLDVQMATLKVCQAISRVEISKMVYTQLLLYRPKK